MAVKPLLRETTVDGDVVVRNRGSKKSFVYDPKTGLWVPVFSGGNNNTPVKKNPTPSSTETGGGSSKNTDSQKEADKEYIEAELNVLNGELKITTSARTTRIKINDTIKVEGLGRYLSGLYTVIAISRTLNKDSGYSHSFTVIRNGFGENVKKPTGIDDAVEPRKDEVDKQTPELKVGDYVKIVGDNAVYSNYHEGVKVPNWVKKETLTIRNFSSDKTKVHLMPINSWTYAKYVRKA